MSLHKVHLRKLLKLFSLSDKELNAEIRKDVTAYIRKMKGAETGGGDFHKPFWRDAKHHLAGYSNLKEEVKLRVEENGYRKRLYPLLSDGFLDWADKQWKDTHIEVRAGIKGTYTAEDIGAIVKVDNILPVKSKGQETAFFYPYFSEDPILSDDAARLGLWVLHTALNEPLETLNILDILRSKPFSVQTNPLNGKEEAFLLYRYGEILKKWDQIYLDITGDEAETGTA
jgi:hypothetical protein